MTNTERLISLLAALLAIFVFMTGIQSLKQWREPHPSDSPESPRPRVPASADPPRSNGGELRVPTQPAAVFTAILKPAPAEPPVWIDRASPVDLPPPTIPPRPNVRTVLREFGTPGHDDIKPFQFTLSGDDNTLIINLDAPTVRPKAPRALELGGVTRTVDLPTNVRVVLVIHGQNNVVRVPRHAENFSVESWHPSNRVEETLP